MATNNGIKFFITRHNDVVRISLESGEVVGTVFDGETEIVWDNLADSENLFRKVPIDYGAEMAKGGLTADAARYIARMSEPRSDFAM